jgi:AraC family transcriptional regulator
MQEEHYKPKRADTSHVHAEAIQRVIGMIRGRLDDSISLSEMAALAYMSRFHFNRTFRQITGLPPRRFLSALRVQAATRLLLDTEDSVTDICLDVGYNSLGTFIRRFSSVLGTTPQKLREMSRAAPGPMPSRVDAGRDELLFKTEPSLKGHVLAPANFSGPIFIGTFATAIPEGAPLACTINHASEDFEMAHVPRGTQYLFAVGLPSPDRVDDYFRHEEALRGGGERVCVGAGPMEYGEIVLRPAIPTDPPILVNLPALLRKSCALKAA